MNVDFSAVAKRMIGIIGALLMIGFGRLESLADDEIRREAGGYLSAWASTVLALESFNFSMVVTESSVLPNGTIEESSIFHVASADHVKKKYLVQSELQQSVTPSDKSPTSFACISAYGLSIDSGWRIDCEGKLSRFKRPVFQSLSELQFPDVRLIGLAQMFSPYPPVADIRRAFDDLFSPSKPLSLQLGREGDVVIGLPLETGSFEFMDRWHINAENYLPQSYVKSVKAVGGKSNKIISEQFQWKDYGGVWLPIKILGERIQIAKVDDTSDVVPYTVTYEAELKWTDINASKDFDSEAELDLSTITRTVRRAAKSFELSSD